MGVDLAESCVQACQERFATELHATFSVNDGLTLPMVADRSVDLVFSFDSLVHVEVDVISSYLRGFRRILSPNGVAFIHHSNLGIYHRTAAVRDLVTMPLGPMALR
jgi:ubiquinone/menaquinone biosynthesis C-methylase UbiE